MPKMPNIARRYQYPLNFELNEGIFVAFQPYFEDLTKGKLAKTIQGKVDSILKNKKKENQNKIDINTSNKKININESPLLISLPFKPIDIQLNHEWSEGKDIIVKMGNKDTLLSTGLATASNLVMQEAMGWLNNQLSGIVDAGLSEIGLGVFEPKKKFFNGTSALTFTLSWTLAPESEKEAREIKDICNLFKYYSMSQASESLERTVFTVQPPLWEMEILADQGVSDGFLYENLFFKDNILRDLVINNVSVKYGENDFYTQIDNTGFPNQITLNVSFAQRKNNNSAAKLFGKIDEIITKKSPSAGKLGGLGG